MAKLVFALHAQAIRQAMEEGLTSADHGVLDGTSIRSSASRHHLFNEERIKKRLEESEHSSSPRRCRSADRIAARLDGNHSSRPPAATQKFSQAEAQLATRLAKNQKRPKDKRLPSKQVRVNPNDPEAPLGRDKEKVFCPLYTANSSWLPSRC